MTVTREVLAHRLKAARERCGFTQRQVAQRLGVSRPTVTQLECGNRGVTALELDKLAYFYGRDIRELLADEFSPEDSLLAVLRNELGRNKQARRRRRA